VCGHLALDELVVQVQELTPLGVAEGRELLG